jgi:hypothetical protein
MPEHDPTRTDRLGAYRSARAAEQTAHDDAVRVVEHEAGYLGMGPDNARKLSHNRRIRARVAYLVGDEEAVRARAPRHPRRAASAWRD